MSTRYINVIRDTLPPPVILPQSGPTLGAYAPLVQYQQPDLHGYSYDDMRRLYLEMNHLDPAHWRHREDFHLENPIHIDVGGKRVLRLQFDVRQFKPEEITLKTVGHLLTVHAKHEDKRDGKTSTREYFRTFALPREVDPDTIHSKLTYGVLTVEAPLQQTKIIL